MSQTKDIFLKDLKMEKCTCETFSLDYQNKSFTSWKYSR